jgi:hypothetical protein
MKYRKMRQKSRLMHGAAEYLKIVLAIIFLYPYTEKNGMMRETMSSNR